MNLLRNHQLHLQLPSSSRSFTSSFSSTLLEKRLINPLGTRQLTHAAVTPTDQTQNEAALYFLYKNPIISYLIIFYTSFTTEQELLLLML